MQSVAAIKTLCEEAGVNLTVVAGPVYAEYLKNYEPETVAQFYRSLAQVTPELLNEMQFDAGSMGPKVTACAKFVSQCRGIAGIGSLADGPEILAGDKGTLIRLDTPHNHA